MKDHSDDEVEILEIAVREFKSMYSYLEKMYENLKNKFILFTSGQLAYLGYLYSSTTVSNQEDQIKRLFIPQELSSQIFYVIGIVFALLSLTFLFQGFLPAPWEVPPKSADLKKSVSKFNTKKEMLIYLKNEYHKAIISNGAVYNSRGETYQKGLACLLIGNVILFIIRFFGNVSIGE
jgi:hypothetical protein